MYHFALSARVPIIFVSLCKCFVLCIRVCVYVCEGVRECVCTRVSMCEGVRECVCECECV